MRKNIKGYYSSVLNKRGILKAKFSRCLPQKIKEEREGKGGTIGGIGKGEEIDERTLKILMSKGVQFLLPD